jgi:intracellular sulfur oxidation DsrE/DsrF family protein
MFIKKIAVSLVVLAMSGAAPLSAQGKVHRVLFAVTSTDAAGWAMTLGNIRNLIAGFPGETVEVEVVAYGPGIGFVKNDATVTKQVKDMESDHVHFMACQNSMNAQHLTAADLTPGVVVVPAGIVEVVKKHEDGWMYVKAGD